MSFINDLEDDVAKAHFIEQTIRNNTVIREAVDQLAPLLTALESKLPEPYKSDLDVILDLWRTIESFSHAQQTNAVSDVVVAPPSVNLQPPVDVQKLAEDAAAAEINAQAHTVVDGQ